MRCCGPAKRDTALCPTEISAAAGSSCDSSSSPLHPHKCSLGQQPRLRSPPAEPRQHPLGYDTSQHRVSREQPRSRLAAHVRAATSGHRNSERLQKAR